MPDAPKDPPGSQALVDSLYDIAIDPEALDGFIGAWLEAGFDAQGVRGTVEKIDRFDAAYADHLARAETLLARASARASGPDFAAMLAPFDSLAAFVVDGARCVVAANAGAGHAFGLEAGAPLSALDLPEASRAALDECLCAVLRAPAPADRLIKVELAKARGTALFQVHGLAGAEGGAPGHALVVTTQYHWRPALGQTLQEVFGLTAAEQAVIRGLVEGSGARQIAEARGTSEGTVRGQIKAILAKTDARTQSEVIRLVMSLQEISRDAETAHPPAPRLAPVEDWLDAEVWKPFETLRLPDGRRMDYHDMGPRSGAPILFSHMGYAMVRWHRPMVAAAFRLNLRVIVPVRAGYGCSSNVAWEDDILEITRADTLFLLDALGIERLPYAPQGNDLIFAVNLAAHVPGRVSEIVGICARPSLPGDAHYAAMGPWHRFYLSTAKHAPHLLRFTARAAVAMCKRIGVTRMYRHMNGSSASDLALIENDHLHAVLRANAELSAGPGTDFSRAYTMELLASEAPWDHIVRAARATPIRFLNGGDDPSYDAAVIAQYREAYPWIDIEIVADGGQLMIYGHHALILPLLADAAHRARGAGLGAGPNLP